MSVRQFFIQVQYYPHSSNSNSSVEYLEWNPGGFSEEAPCRRRDFYQASPRHPRSTQKRDISRILRFRASFASSVWVLLQLKIYNSCPWSASAALKGPWEARGDSWGIAPTGYDGLPRPRGDLVTLGRRNGEKKKITLVIGQETG